MRKKIAASQNCIIGFILAFICCIGLLLGLHMRYSQKADHLDNAGNVTFAESVLRAWHNYEHAIAEYALTQSESAWSAAKNAFVNLDQKILALRSSNDYLAYISKKNIDLDFDALAQNVNEIAPLMEEDAAFDSSTERLEILQKLHEFEHILEPLHEYQSGLMQRQLERLRNIDRAVTTVLIIGIAFCVLIMVASVFRIWVRWLSGEDAEGDAGKARYAQSVLDRRKAEILEGSPDAILITNEDGLIEYVNAPMSLFLQGAQETLAIWDAFYHQPWYNIFPKDKQLHLKQTILADLQAQGHWTGDIVIEPEGKEQKTLQVSLRTLSDQALIGIFKDITDQKLSERETAELRKQFFQAQKMESIGRMAGGIAHDFNNILSAIMGYAEFLEEDLPPESTERKFAAKIMAASQQAKSLINRILSFSRRGTGELIPVDLAHLLQVTHDMIQSSASDAIEIRLENHLKDAYILGNPTEVSQVLMNLCVNARDAMEDMEGRLSLSMQPAIFDKQDIKCFTRAADEGRQAQGPQTRIVNVSNKHTNVYAGVYDPEKKYYCIEIADTGTGILPAIIEQIFEPFFTTKDQDKGTGLGLSSSLGIVTGHKGLLKVSSVVGEGTSFKLYFPVESIAADALAKDQKQADALMAEGRVSRNTQEQDEAQKDEAARKKVLLVDDDDAVRETIGMMLFRFGFDVKEFAAPREALDHAATQIGEYDLLITDYMMPDMKGGELAAAIHNLAPDLPVMVISGYTEDAFESGVTELSYIKAFLRKPLERQAFHAALADIFEDMPES